MSKRALNPPGLRGAGTDLKLSAGYVSHGHVFLTGLTGSDVNGEMPQDPARQFHAAFDKIEQVLRKISLGLGDIVEMTTYHVQMSAHFDAFDAVRVDRLGPGPYPAWTAVEVAGLRRTGALVEIRVVAHIPET